MPEIFHVPSEGSLEAFVSIDPDTQTLVLLWYVHIDLKPIARQRNSCRYSLNLEGIEFHPRTWIDLQHTEYEGSFDGSFYDGSDAVHHQISHFKINILDRIDNIFNVFLNAEYEEPFYIEKSITQQKMIGSRINAKLKFLGIKIEEHGLKVPHESFHSADFLKSLLSKMIRLDCLQGPFYPFPPVQPYSKQSHAFFEPVF